MKYEGNNNPSNPELVDREGSAVRFITGQLKIDEVFKFPDPLDIVKLVTNVAKYCQGKSSSADVYPVLTRVNELLARVEVDERFAHSEIPSQIARRASEIASYGYNKQRKDTKKGKRIANLWLEASVELAEHSIKLLDRVEVKNGDYYLAVAMAYTTACRLYVRAHRSTKGSSPQMSPQLEQAWKHLQSGFDEFNDLTFTVDQKQKKDVFAHLNSSQVHLYVELLEIDADKYADDAYQVFKDAADAAVDKREKVEWYGNWMLLLADLVKYKSHRVSLEEITEIDIALRDEVELILVEFSYQFGDVDKGRLYALLLKVLEAIELTVIKSLEPINSESSIVNYVTSIRKYSRRISKICNQYFEEKELSEKGPADDDTSEE